MTHKTNYFIKEGAHDHRKKTKLLMSPQSSDIKFAAAILQRLLTLTPIRSRMTQKIYREPPMKLALCNFGIVKDP